MPNYSQLKTAVKLHIDQTMRTRNFRVRSDVVERGSVTKSQKRKKAYVERKVEECFQWKAHGHMFQKRLMQLQSWHNCLWKQSRWPETKRTIVFSRIQFEGKADWRRGTKEPSKESGNKEEGSSDKRRELPCRFRILKKIPVMSVLASSQNVQLWKRMCIWRQMPFPTCWGRRKAQQKVEWRWSKKDQLCILKESTQLGCVSQNSYPRKSTLREPRKYSEFVNTVM